MGHIKEPKGVDFIIASDMLTDKARKEISDFIRKYKTNVTKKKVTSTLVKKQRKVTHALR